MEILSNAIRSTALRAACVVAMLVVASAQAQPSPRGLVEMAYDSHSEVFVLFGGLVGPFDRAGSVVGGTWVFDPATDAWTERTPDISPPALLAANITYDSGSDRIVLWGGADASFQGNTDVWTYDVDANTWARLDMDPAGGPEHRAGSRMAYDPVEDLIVMFGGQDTTDGSFPDTTWLLDIDTRSWSLIDTETAPRGRFFYGLAYEPTSDMVYAWGGGAPILDTLWAFDTSELTWSEVPPSEPAPFPQGQVGMVAVPELGGLLVVGGESQGNDVAWRYDVAADAWSEMGEVPFDVRNRFAIAHAPGFGTLLFGGQVGNASFAFSDQIWWFAADDRSWWKP